MKKLAVLTSGGDSPGMNCAIRSIVRTAIGEGIEIYGARRGYQGLIEGSLQRMEVSSVGNILHMGGTILQTSRSEEFRTKEGRIKAMQNLRIHGIEGLIVIGGNGSFSGAKALFKDTGMLVCGVPATIDNDISGTAYSIGFDTAVQTAIESVDKIRNTASSHERIFIVEVMGRKSPAIAVHVGVCSGAENIIFPYKGVNYERIVSDLNRGIKRGKTSSIIIVGEGEKPGLSYEVQQKLHESYDLNAHVCILGHIQRGGSPTHRDRFIASKMGNIAVKTILAEEVPQAVIYDNGSVSTTNLDNCLETKVEYEKPFLELVRSLSI